MFNHILVPLDGSRLSEAALPPAVALARCFGSHLTLVHVIEHNAPEKVHGERHITDEREACAYLDELAQTLPPEMQVETHVHTEEVSNVARSIAEHIQELGQDLVVMCAHGEGGIKQWMVGNIAQKVINMGKTPVLLVQPEPQAGQFAVHNILAALDNNPAHIGGLKVAAAVAASAKARLHLLTVVQRLENLGGHAAATGRLLPSATTILLEIQEAEALSQLELAAEPYRKAGQTVTCAVRRGDPATQIAEGAAAIGADIIVLGTHGKAGMQAFWAGSVAPRLPSMTHIALLLVPTVYA